MTNRVAVDPLPTCWCAGTSPAAPWHTERLLAVSVKTSFILRGRRGENVKLRPGKERKEDQTRKEARNMQVTLQSG